MADAMPGMKSSPAPTRDRIIAHLVAALEPLDAVAAAWLEGADGRGTVDEHSDIDFVIAVNDGWEAEAFTAVEDALSALAPIDRSLGEPGGAAGLQHRVYHLAGTPPGLLLDVVVQSRSREFAFDPEHPSEVPLPLFDRDRVIRFEGQAPGVRADERDRAWNDAKARFLPEARVRRYVSRGRFLEGLAAYQKYVLGPLVELLRLKHAPATVGYGLVHVSEHLPPDVLQRLETLYRVGSVDDLALRLSEATRWFDEIVSDGPGTEGNRDGS